MCLDREIDAIKIPLRDMGKLHLVPIRVIDIQKTMRKKKNATNMYHFVTRDKRKTLF
jgi:hypothetical protein